jgi:hypothetical protein
MPISTSILEDAGLLRKGHFILPDGRHSDTYLDFMQAVEHPNVMMPYIEELARLVASIDYTHVSGVSPGGDIVASQVAIQIGGSIYGLSIVKVIAFLCQASNWKANLSYSPILYQIPGSLTPPKSRLREEEEPLWA